MLFHKILKANNIYNLIKKTDLEFLPLVSKQVQNNIYIKREDQHLTSSYKIRGALNKLNNIKEDIVICASSGNFATSISYACKFLNKKSIVVMPKNTPQIKIDNVKNFGGKIILEGDTFDKAFLKAEQLSQEYNYPLIHPFNDIDIIAGNGTIAREILDDLDGNTIHGIFCTVGGGGLISGISQYTKTLYPNINIYGAEHIGSNAMTQSLKKNKLITLNNPCKFSDGNSVSTPGNITFDICKKNIDNMINVSTKQICEAVKMAYLDTKIVFEPAGLNSLAGLIKFLKYNNIIKNKNFIVIGSGANLDFNKLHYIYENTTN